MKEIVYMICRHDCDCGLDVHGLYSTEEIANKELELIHKAAPYHYWEIEEYILDENLQMDIKYARLGMEVVVPHTYEKGTILEFKLSEENRFYVEVELESGDIKHLPLACVCKY